MYLTQVEYDVLYGFKMKRPLKEIREDIERKYGIHMGMNDPIVESLYEKYGVYDRTELCQKADLCKVDIVSEENMPYYQYDSRDPRFRKELVKQIVFTKRDLLRLVKYINSREDNGLEEKFAIVRSDGGLGHSIYIKDSEGKTYMLGAWVDGDISDEELDNWGNW